MDNGTEHPVAASPGDGGSASGQRGGGGGGGDGAGPGGGDNSVPTIPVPAGAEKKWYIVNTYSGHENKAKLTLIERVQKHGLQEFFGDVLVPTESVTENIKGQRRTMTRKFFPGYMFVQMILDDRTFHLVKNTPKITGFLGGTKPTPVPEREITGVQSNVAEGKTGKAKARVTFEPGESVRGINHGSRSCVMRNVVKVNIKLCRQC